MEHYDVIVIGGGPAGSSAAGFLAQSGARVLLFEKEIFPRYHIGESMLSATMPILDALGVMPAVEAAGFLRKPGGTFIWGESADPWSFFFREDPGGRPHAFQVLRSQFDHILLQHAASLGVDVREGHQVREIRSAADVEVTVSDRDNRPLQARASYLIDASGQSALIGQRDRLREFNPFFKNLAIFGYFSGAQRLDGNLAGNILSAAFADGWFWFIPLHDGTTSVGAVIDAHKFAGEASAGADALYRRLISSCPAVAARVAAAELVSPVRVIRDYSYCSSRFFGERFLLAGDAACFIDPVFSTGVHLACLSGYLSSKAVAAILAGADERAEQELYDQQYRSAFERYLNFLYFFYDHHVDADSYFWKARKILEAPAQIDQRTAFVRLMSGGGDLLHGDASLRDELAARHERMSRAVLANRFSAIPGNEIFRVRSTLQTMAETNPAKKDQNGG